MTGERKNRVIPAHCHDVHNSLVNQSSSVASQLPIVIFLLFYFYTIIIFLLNISNKKNLNIFSVEGLNLIDTYCNYKDENTKKFYLLELSILCAPENQDT